MLVASPALLPIRRTALELLTQLGLTGNLQLLLDAGDANSYTSGQSWLDVSGNGHDFFLGADGSATATDPTFNGTAGAKSQSNYFSFDGGDYFRYDTSNPAWIENLHKDNAAFTLVTWVWPGSAASHQLFGTHQASASNIGVGLGANASNGNFTLSVSNGSGTFARSLAQNVGVSASAWQFLAARVDEAADVGFMVRNSTKGADASVSYTTPSASSATRTAEIGAAGNGSGPVSNTTRIAMFMGFSAALSAAQIQLIFNATRGRFQV